MELLANTTGATLVKNTLATPGTIGYATMADAVYTVAGEPFEGAPQVTTYHSSAAHQYLWAALQTDHGQNTSTRHYAEPRQVTAYTSGSLEALTNVYTGNSTGGCT